MRIIFAGTPKFAADHLRALLANNHSVIGVFTQPDRPSGRGKKLTPSPVKTLSLEYGLPIFQPASLRPTEHQQTIKNLNPDLMIVVAYGLLLPQTVLDLPTYGCINVHASLLPRWRGAAPIQRAIWAGDQETGTTIMQMDVGLDTGDILYHSICPITSQDTSATLFNKLALSGAAALLTTVKKIGTDQLNRQQQDDAQASYAKKLSKIEAKLDWSLPATQLERCIRAFNPWPCSFFNLEGEMIKVLRAEAFETPHSVTPGTILQADKHGLQIATAQGVLSIFELQPPGKRVMSVQDLLNSRQDQLQAGKLLD